MTERQDHDIEALLDEVAGRAPPPDAAFLARMEAQARRMQPPPTGIARPGRRGGGVFDLLGGWAGLGGLATAAATGLWLGLAPPAALMPLFAGAVTVDILPETAPFLDAED